MRELSQQVRFMAKACLCTCKQILFIIFICIWGGKSAPTGAELLRVYCPRYFLVSATGAAVGRAAVL